MAYATIDDVFKRYPPISTMVGVDSADVASDDISSIYISDAEGIINAYLGAKYATPLVSEPIVTMLTSDIAIYKMIEDRAPRVPEIAEKRYTNATSMLCMLRDGQMVLISSPAVAGDEDVYSTTGSFHPVFSPVLGELDQRVDNDQVQADRDEREDDAPRDVSW